MLVRVCVCVDRGGGEGGRAGAQYLCNKERTADNLSLHSLHDERSPKIIKRDQYQ